jgi:hypothetical protein
VSIRPVRACSFARVGCRQSGVFQSTNGFPLNPTIQQMANMQLHQVPTGTNLSIYGNQVYHAAPPVPQASQQQQLPQQNQQQPIYRPDSARGFPILPNPPDSTEYLASPQRNMSFGSWYQPISPGLMAAPPILPVHDGSVPPPAQQHQSPVNIGSSPLANIVSPVSDNCAAGPSISMSPNSSVFLRPVDLGASLSPSSSSSGHLVSPFGDGYSSNMPVLNEHAGSVSTQVYINRPVKKRACEQCNTSKVRCDSQLPCRECHGRTVLSREKTLRLTALHR